MDLEDAVKIEQGLPVALGATWNGRGPDLARLPAFLLEGAAPPA
jgi:hypothetical protein